MLNKILHNKLFTSAGLYTVSNLVNASIPFLLLPVLTRYLSSTDYGITATFQILLGFFVPFIGLNTQFSITRQFFNRENIDFSSYVANCIQILIASSLVLILIVLLCSDWVSKLTEFPRAWLPAVMIVSFFQFLNAVVLSIWQAEGNVLKYSILQNSQTLLNICLSLILVISFRYNWEGRVMSQVISTAAAGFFSISVLYRLKFLKGALNFIYVKDALKFGLPLIPYTFAGWIMMSIDRIFLNKMISVSETGLYAVGYQITMIITLLQLSFNHAWVPWIFEKIKNEDSLLKVKIVKLSYIYIAANFFLAILLSLFGPPLLRFLLGTEFHESSKYLLWLSLAQAANAIHIIAVSYISFYNKNIYLTYSATLSTIVHIPITYFLIKTNGSIGAAQALLISNLMISTMTFMIANRIHKMPWALWKLNKMNITK